MEHPNVNGTECACSLRAAEKGDKRIVSVAAAIASAAVFALSSCAGSKKSVLDMTSEDFVKENPDCSVVSKGADSIVRDETLCVRKYVRAQLAERKRQKEKARLALGFAPRESTPEERAAALARVTKDRIQGTEWWEANMVQKSSETPFQFADRIEIITTDLLESMFAECRDSAAYCGKEDGRCFSSVKQTAAAILDIGNILTNEVIKAWQDAEDSERAKKAKTNLSKILGDLMKFSASLRL